MPSKNNEWQASGIPAMETIDTFRARYGSASDADLRAILGAGLTHLTPDAHEALIAELRRRGMLGEINPLDNLFWPAEMAEVPRYSKVRFRTRLAAYVVDVLVACFPFLLTALLVILGIEVPFAFLLALFGGIISVCWAIYYSLTKDGQPGGQSIGKKKFNLLVVNITTNQPCTTAESLIRQIDLCCLQMIPVVGWLVEPIVMLASKDGRRLGDRAANTQVIDIAEYRRPA